MRNRFIYILALFFLCLSVESKASNKLSPNQKELLNKIEILADENDNATFEKKWKAYYYEARKLNCGDNIYMALNKQKVIFYYYILKLDSVEKYVPDLLAYYRKKDDAFQYYNIKGYLADAYTAKGMITRAVDIGQKMLNEAIKYREEAGIGFGTYSLAIAYYTMYDFKRAIPYFEKAIPVFYKEERWSFYVAVCANYIEALIETKDLKKAIIHFNTVDSIINISQHSKHPFISPTMIPCIKGLIASQIYLGLKNPGMIKKYLTEIERFYKYNPNISKEHLYQTRRIYAEATKNYKEEIAYIDTLIQYYKGQEDQSNIFPLYKNKSEAYESLGLYKESLSFLKDYINSKDSIDTKDAQERIDQFSADYKTQHLEVDKKNLQIKMRDSQIKYFTLFIVILSISIIIALILINYHHKLNKKLRNAIKVKDDFIHHITHEIRTPLNYMLGFADVIAENADKDEDEKEMAKCMHLGGDELLKMFDDMLLSIDVDNKTYEPEGIDLKATCEIVTAKIKPYMQTGVSLNIEYEKDCPAIVYINLLGLQYIMYNLLHNAAKYTQSGYIKLSFKKDKKDTLCISICNTGKRIIPEEQDKIFDQFYKSDPYSQGLGLGLTNSLKVAQLMKGTIILNTKNTAETEFIIQLPLK
jgi:signal transduction histidine kinase